jgi:DNA-binding SARP family transcriptional activator
MMTGGRRAEFRVLGTLDVRCGAKEIAVPIGRQRAILAALLLRINRTVSINELTEMVWEDAQPSNSRGTIQKYIMRLRRVLAGTDVVIRTEPNGYRLDLCPERTDLGTFTDLVEQGKLASKVGDHALAADRLAAALALWRDIPPLTNVDATPLHRVEVPLLIERYLEAMELRIEADLNLGRHRDVSADLLGLLRRHPFRERFWAQRMRALYASGRQGEALESYREVVGLLADELGIEPSPELSSLHQMILRSQEPDIVATAPSVLVNVAQELPMVANDPVGREAEIGRIVTALGAAAGPRLIVIHGQPGSGKTTVAVRATERLVEAFPEGHLFADLHGHTDGSQRVEDVLARFLRALGVAASAMPTQLDDAIALFRTLTAKRRVLVVIDDAARPDQVRALLPGGSTSAAVVTSRHELPGLLATPGGDRIHLRMLGVPDSLTILRGMLGEHRVSAELGEAHELAQLCGYSPLALRVAGAYLAMRPQEPIVALVKRLLTEDPTTVLRLEGDSRSDVGASLNASFAQLSAELQRFFVVVASAPVVTLSAIELSAYTSTTAADIAEGCERLAERGLLERAGDRYELHPLTRAFVAGYASRRNQL